MAGSQGWIFLGLVDERHHSPQYDQHFMHVQFALDILTEVVSHIGIEFVNVFSITHDAA